MRHEDEGTAYLCSCFTLLERGHRYDVGMSSSPGQRGPHLPSSALIFSSLAPDQKSIKGRPWSRLDPFSFSFLSIILFTHHLLQHFHPDKQALPA